MTAEDESKARTIEAMMRAPSSLQLHGRGVLLEDAIRIAREYAEAQVAAERVRAERDQSEQREMLWSEINALRERRNKLEAENERLRGLWAVTGGEMTKQTSRAERAEAALANMTQRDAEAHARVMLLQRERDEARALVGDLIGGIANARRIIEEREGLDPEWIAIVNGTATLHQLRQAIALLGEGRAEGGGA